MNQLKRTPDFFKFSFYKVSLTEVPIGIDVVPIRTPPPYYAEMSFIADTYKSSTLDFYNKQRVAFLKETGAATTTCFDFNDFYARIIMNINSDLVLSRALHIATELRPTDPRIKLDVVTLLGKLKHYDRPLFNLMKAYSVAIMCDVCQRNSKKLHGATTDGIILKGRCKNITFPMKSQYPLKLEWTGKFYYGHYNKYVGRSSAKIIIKGFVGHSKLVLGLQKYVRCLFLLLLKKKTTAWKVLEKAAKLLRHTLTPSDFYVTNCSTTHRARKPVEYLYNELCQDRNLVYYDQKYNNRIRSQLDKNESLKPYDIIHVNACFGLDVDRYIELFTQKTKEVLCFCKKVTGLKRFNYYYRHLSKIIQTEITSRLDTKGDVVIPGAIWKC